MSRADTVINLATARMTFLATSEKLIVRDVVSSVRFFETLSLDDIRNIVGRRINATAWDPSYTISLAEADCVYLERREISALSYWDAAYPAVLREIHDPPYLLFLRGTLSPGGRPPVSIVGTRRPSRPGRAAAYRTAREVAEIGLPVVSGLARGIDTAAHQGCLDGGGMTVAVLGNGIDAVYPPENKPLAREILAAGGALISEYPPGTPPLKYHFPARNRIITGLSRGVVIVEAPERSGALISAEFALEQGRDIFVHADGMAGESGVGTATLAEDGAIVVRNAGEIAEEWGIESLPDRGTPSDGTIGDASSEHESAPAAPGATIAAMIRGEIGGMEY